jgi:hypothetical protein
MIYREFLVMRKALAWFAAVLLALIVTGLASKAIRIAPVTEVPDIGPTSGYLAAIFASIFGVALGNGSREAARILWVLPAARWKLALQVIGVDLAGTTVAFVCAYAIILSLFVLAGLHVRANMFGTVDASRIIMALAMAYATYGWSALVGMLGRRMAYSGIIALPALMIWMSLVQQVPILRTVSVANPFIVFNAAQLLKWREQHRFSLDPTTSSLQWLGSFWETPVLFAIALVTCGLAVALWQRAQAIN